MGIVGGRKCAWMWVYETNGERRGEERERCTRGGQTDIQQRLKTHVMSLISKKENA